MCCCKLVVLPQYTAYTTACHIACKSFQEAETARQKLVQIKPCFADFPFTSSVSLSAAFASAETLHSDQPQCLQSTRAQTRIIELSLLPKYPLNRSQAIAHATLSSLFAVYGNLPSSLEAPHQALCRSLGSIEVEG
jgi:hypothetical protein